MPVSLEELLQLYGLKQLHLDKALADQAALQQQVAQLEAALAAAPKPRSRKQTA